MSEKGDFFSPPLFVQQQPTCSIIIVVVRDERAAGRLRPRTRVGRGAHLLGAAGAASSLHARAAGGGWCGDD